MEKLSGGEELDFLPWDGEEGALHGLGDCNGNWVCSWPQTFGGSMNLSFQLSYSWAPGPSLSQLGKRVGYWQKPAQDGKRGCTEPVPVQEAGAAATVRGSRKPTAEWNEAWVIFFPVCWHVGGFFSFFLLSCSLLFPQRCGSLQICLRGGERQALAWGSLSGASGAPKSIARKLGTIFWWYHWGREGSVSFPLEAAGMLSLLCSALGSQIHPTWWLQKTFSSPSFALQCWVLFSPGSGQAMGTPETLLPSTSGAAGCSEELSFFF